MNLQNELVVAAVTLFEAKGYARTSVQDIVTAAGVTKGAFYHYFSGKEDVLLLIHEQHINRLLRQSREVYDNQSLHPGEKLEKLIDVALMEIAQYGAYAKVFFVEKNHLSSNNLMHIHAKRDEYASLFENVVRDGIAAGFFRAELDPVITSLGILGICNWTYQWFRPSGRYSIEVIARMFGDIVKQGIAPGKFNCE